MADETQDYQAFQSALKAKYFVPDAGGALFRFFDSVLSPITDMHYLGVGQAFRSNIDGLVTTLSLPFHMAADRVIDDNYKRLYEKAKVARTPDVSTPDKDDLTCRHDPIHQEALTTFRQLIETEAGRIQVLKEASDVLDYVYSDKPVAANELLLQGAVLCWSGLEVFCRDFFTAYVNKNPRICRELNKSKETKERFELSTKTLIESLEGNDYNLSSLMGTILAHRQDFSDFESVRCTYKVLFPTDSPFEEDQIKPNLGLLAARRNLIVHRRGVIDSKYHNVDKTTVVGERLKLLPEDVRTHVISTIAAATVLLNLVSPVPVQVP